MSWFNFRIDRVLTTSIFHPVERLGAPAPARLPILMYHSLSSDPEAGVAAYYKTNTDPLVFRQQMRYLASSGYRTLSLTEVEKKLRQNEGFAPQSLVITFDDGFRDFYQHGFQVLREHGFTATMFLPTAYIAEERRTFKGIECLTWSEVREMREAGISFGSHTVHHPVLKELSWAEIAQELTLSKQKLEEELGSPSPLFSYPYAFPQENQIFARQFREALQQAGYACCVTTELGRVGAGDDVYRLKRLPANSLDDPALFRAKLEGGYDWLAVPQAVIKKLKQRSRGSSGPQAATHPVSI